MKRFKIKTKEVQKVLNLQDELEFCDHPVTLTVTNYDNPLNDMDAIGKLTEAERVWYFDRNGNLYSKEYIDIYYEEVK